MRRSVLLSAAVAGGLVSASLLLPASTSTAAGTTGAAGTCVPATNIQAIVDDSGSMASTDPGRLRVQAMSLLIDALGDSTTLGATEFGSSAAPIFAPAPVGPGAPAMKAALDTSVQADGGTTNYTVAFDTARAANPGATARIFLTDGGHNVGVYANAHLNPPPTAQTPTYVIGFSPGLTDPADQARLTQIAADTGGRYFPLPDAAALQSVMNEIQTSLTCQSKLKTYSDNLKAGKSKRHSASVNKKSKSAQLTLSWGSSLDSFKITDLQIKRGGKVVASQKGRFPKLKVKTKSGATYRVIKVTKLVPGKLTFKVKATDVASLPQVLVTTQVSQSRKKR